MGIDEDSNIFENANGISKDMIPIKQAKTGLRKAVKASLKSLTERDIADQSAKVHERLYSMPEYQKARHISIYLAMSTGEVQTQSIVCHALREGKTVFVPYLFKNSTTGPRALMDMVALHSEDDYNTSLKPDGWGIPSIDSSTVTQRARCISKSFEDEAHHDESPERLESLDLVVVPGVAFDRARHRLGHGKGFYDIFLDQYRESKGSDTDVVTMPYLVGLALDQQLLPDGENVPVDSSDWTLDAVLSTDTAIRQAQAGLE